MQFEHCCDTFVNASEEVALQAVRKHLSGLECGHRAIAITNIAHAIGNTGQPDEIDMIVVATGEVLYLKSSIGIKKKLRKIYGMLKMQQI